MARDFAMPLYFLRSHVGRMNEAPVRSHWRVIQQPLDRSLAGPGEALLDFLHLLSNVDVDGRRSRKPCDSSQLFRSYRAQTVRARRQRLPSGAERARLRQR